MTTATTETTAREQYIFDLDGTLFHSANELQWLCPDVNQVKPANVMEIVDSSNTKHRSYFQLRHFSLELLKALKESSNVDLYMYTMSGATYAHHVNETYLIDAETKQPFIPRSHVFSLSDQIKVMEELKVPIEEMSVNVVKKKLLYLNHYLQNNNLPLIDKTRCLIFDDRVEMWPEERNSLLVHVPVFEGQNAQFDTALYRVWCELYSLERPATKTSLSLHDRWHRQFRSDLLQGSRIYLHKLEQRDYFPFFTTAEELCDAIKLLGAEVITQLQNDAVPTHIIFGYQNEVTLTKKLFANNDINIVHITWLLHIWFFRQTPKTHYFIGARPEYLFSDFNTQLFPKPLQAWLHANKIIRNTYAASPLHLACKINSEAVNNNTLTIHLESTQRKHKNTKKYRNPFDQSDESSGLSSDSKNSSAELDCIKKL